MSREISEAMKLLCHAAAPGLARETLGRAHRRPGCASNNFAHVSIALQHFCAPRGVDREAPSNNR